MNLLQVIRNFQDSVVVSSKDEAVQELVDMGVDPAVRTALVECFDDKGQAIAHDADGTTYQETFVLSGYIERFNDMTVEQFMKELDAGKIEFQGGTFKGIIGQCHEWMGEGWGVEMDEPTPAMVAGALYNEAATQYICAARGESAAEFPIRLRSLADTIVNLWLEERQEQADAESGKALVRSFIKPRK